MSRHLLSLQYYARSSGFWNDGTLIGKPLRLVERVIDLTGLPEMMEQDGQLSGDGDDSSPFCIFPSAFSKLQAPTAQVAIRSKGSQDVLSGSHEQAAQVRVSGLGDAQLRVVSSRLISPRDEALSCESRKLETPICADCLSVPLSTSLVPSVPTAIFAAGA